jgi:hypothetical protein
MQKKMGIRVILSSFPKEKSSRPRAQLSGIPFLLRSREHSIRARLFRISEKGKIRIRQPEIQTQNRAGIKWRKLTLDIYKVWRKPKHSPHQKFLADLQALVIGYSGVGNFLVQTFGYWSA